MLELDAPRRSDETAHISRFRAPEVRKIIRTTDAIESLRSQARSAIRNLGLFRMGLAEREGFEPSKGYQPLLP